ncbi:MAG: efflux RND transporter periplasmic adaptor subunit, partial [Candidatus Xenobia bacterium]
RGTVTETVLTTGQLAPTQTVNVGSQVSGLVTRLYVDWNSPVHKGQVVAEIDPRIPRAQMEQAQADLDNARAQVLNNQATLKNQESNLESAQAAVETAEANVGTAEGGVTTARAGVLQAVAGLDKAQAQLHVANLTLDRDNDLRAKDLIAQNDLDQARASRDVAQANLETAQGQLEQARASFRSAQIALKNAHIAVQTAGEKRDAAHSLVAAAQAQVEAAEASVKRNEANMVQARLNLSYTTIRSPVDGVVLERNVDQGQTIQASYSAPQLYVIGTNLKQMQVVAALSESDISRVYAGEKATFTVDAYPDDSFDGEVTQVRNKATTTDNVVTYQVVIQVKNPELKLRPGMTANISLQVRKHEKVLRVPNAALRWKPQEDPSASPTPTPSPTPSPSASASPGATPSAKKSEDKLPDETDHQKVWVLKDNKPVSVDIVTGLADGSNTEVLSGLHDGEAVIVSATYPPKAERKEVL